MTVVTGQRAASESEIQEGDVPPEGQPDPTKVQLVEDDDGEWVGWLDGVLLVLVCLCW